MKHTKTLIAIVLLSALFCSCTAHRESAFIQTADSLLWANPDSCISFCIENRDICRNENEKAIITLIQEHASFKIARTLESDSTLYVLEEYFSSKDDYRHLGEVYYILGTNYSLQGISQLGTTYLKKAEDAYRQANNVPDILIGMLYFQFGCNTKNAQLYSIAQEYYNESLSYLRQTKHFQYTYTTYLHLACNEETNNDSLAIQFIDSALYYALLANDPIAYKEAEIIKYQYLLSSDTNIIIKNMIYLCDSLQKKSYAAEITSFYIEKHELNNALKYLEELAQDTSNNLWSKEQFYLLHAQIALQQNKEKKAYQILKELNDWKTIEIEESTYNQSYIISQKYDVAKEQELRLQEQVKKQQAYFWIAVVLLVCICIGGYTYYINKKRKLELQLSNEQKKRLEEELHTNRAVLRARIKERIEVVKELNAWSSHHSEKIPDILGTLSPKQAASDPQNWQEFYTEFNLCYDNLLAKLKEQYPALTESDMQYIAITYLGFNGTDMGFLLNITKRTIWNRKNHVKQHMSMSEDLDLDNWILHELHK